METWYAEITFADLYKQLRGEPKLLRRLLEAIERTPSTTTPNTSSKN
jgi:hypothetical protein